MADGVGRKKEFEKLASIWSSVQKKGDRPVLVTGDPGAGKTFLLRSFARKITFKGGVAAIGQCVDGGGIAYRPIKEILRQFIPLIESSGENDQTLAQMGTILSTLIPELWDRPFMKDAKKVIELNLESSQQRLNDAVIQAIRIGSRNQPTVVVIEDVHWADDATITLLELISTVLILPNLMVAVSFRVEKQMYEDETAVLDRDQFHTIHLEPFSLKKTSEFITAMSAITDVPDSIAVFFHEISKGNPYFLKEYLRFLIDEGKSIQNVDAAYDFTSNFLEVSSKPSSLFELIKWRLQNLSGLAQKALTIGSVLGPIISDDAISTIGNIPVEDIRKAFNELLREEFVIEREPFHFKGEYEYIFNQEVVKKACYSSLSSEKRHHYHHQVALWLKQQSEQHLDEYLGRIAEHFEKAGKTKEALNYLMQAGGKAATQFANREALEFLNRALKLLPEDAISERYSLILVREEVYSHKGARDEQLRDISLLEKYANLLNDDQRRIQVLMRRILYREQTVDYKGAIHASKELITLSEKIRDAKGLAEGYYRWGGVLWRMGEFDECQAILKRTLSLAKGASLRSIESGTTRILGIVSRRLGNYSETMIYHEKVLELERKSGNLTSECSQLMNIGLVYVSLGDFKKAHEYYENSLKLAKNIGLTRISGLTLANLAELLGLEERYEEAVEVGKKGIDFGEGINHPRVAAYGYMAVGDALSALKRFKEAKIHLQKGYDLFHGMGNEHEAMKNLNALAHIDIIERNADDAKIKLEEVLKFEGEHTLVGASLPFYVYMQIYNSLVALKDYRAKEILTKAHQFLTEQAENIKEEKFQRVFMENIPAHVAVMKEFLRVFPDLHHGKVLVHEKGDERKKTNQKEPSELLAELKLLRKENKELKSVETYYKHSEAALLESEKRFKSIAENANDAIITFDDKENILFWNQSANNFFGYSGEENRNRLLVSILIRQIKGAFEKNIEDVANKDLKDFTGKSMEVTGVRKDGSEFPLEISLSIWEKGESHIYTVIGRDITERRRAEKELQKAKTEIEQANRELEVAMTETKAMAEKADEANRAKSEFLANMSHEIRTPMNAIIGMTHLTLGTALSKEQSEYLRAVKISADNLLSLINDILDFSKIEAGHLEMEEIAFDLRETMESVADTLSIKAAENKVELISHIRTGVPELLIGDPGRLRQILLNLGGNSIKFTKDGEVCITSSIEWEKGKIAQFHFSISDTGIGIPKEKQNAIFESFQQVDGSTTRKYGGTGLGLSISKQLVEKMGGRIWVESEEGKGSIFHFTANFEVRIGETKKSDQLKHLELRDKKILIVDDNKNNRILFQEILKKWGITCDVAIDGDHAIRKLVRDYENHTFYDLILMDYMMPNLNGIKTAEYIREDRRFDSTLIVMATSMGMKGELKNFKRNRISTYILKPIKENELLETLNFAFQEGQSEGASKSSPQKIDNSISKEKPAVKELYILLTEDNKFNQMMAGRLLEKLGHQVVIAQNGQEAIDRLEENEFDMVLMDVQMPVMDGLTATRNIRKLNSDKKNIPIIAMTAYAMKGDREKCFKAGMDDYLSKPIDPDKLIEMLEKWG